MKTLIGLVGVGVVLVGLIGWVMNIVQLCHAATMSGMTIARGIGVFVVPLGAVLGWI